MRYSDEHVGASGPAFDIAVDPLECTTFCASGLPGSLAAIAFAGANAMQRPGPSHYGAVVTESLVISERGVRLVRERSVPRQEEVA
jgi:fructose-1,6-bisphosphatase/sedoheptulose 1,7-bisphosphatase-like protein